MKITRLTGTTIQLHDNVASFVGSNVTKYKGKKTCSEHENEKIWAFGTWTWLVADLLP